MLSPETETVGSIVRSWIGESLEVLHTLVVGVGYVATTLLILWCFYGPAITAALLDSHVQYLHEHCLTLKGDQ